MANESLDKWRSAAMALESTNDVWPAPQYVMTTEATQLVAFAKRYWEPTKDAQGNQTLPGLVTTRLRPEILTELTELVEAAQQAQSAQLMTLPPVPGDELDRGRWLVGEIRAALEYHLDDGVTDTADAQLARIATAHRDDPNSIAALAAELADYAALAEPHRAVLDGLGGFSAASLDEAKAVVPALRARGAVEMDRAASAAAVDLRNRILTLLADRVSEVRSAARFVFRNHPEIARLATSAYERRRRAAARRSAAEDAAAPAAAPAAPVTAGPA